MKHFAFLSTKFLAFLCVAVFLVSSCTSDEGPIELDPTITLVDEAGFVSQDTTLSAGATFTVKLLAEVGDNPLNTLTVFENNEQVDPSNLSYAHAAGGSANPMLAIDADKEGFEWEVTVTVPTAAGDYTYDFEVSDDASNTNVTSVTITIGSQAPVFVNNSGSMLSVQPGSLAEINVVATAGSSPLDVVGVYEAGNLISDASRLYFNQVAFTANPETLVGDDRNGFSAPIWIRAHNTIEVKQYIIEVVDEAGEVGTINIEIATGTNVTELTGALLNADGPSGQGGLNLVTGNGNINSSDASAQIRDQGIDASLPVESNWLRKIAGVNGSILRTPGGEFGGYDSVTSKEEIESGFTAGSTIAESNAITVGDEFLVESNGEFFVIKVTNVTPTTNDNADSYEFSIKY